MKIENYADIFVWTSRHGDDGVDIVAIIENMEAVLELT